MKFKVQDKNLCFGWFATEKQAIDKANNILLATGSRPKVYQEIECFTCKGMGGDCCEGTGKDYIEIEKSL